MEYPAPARNPARSAGEQKLPKILTFAGFRGVESVARFQLVRLAIVGGASLAGVLLCVWVKGPFLIGALAGAMVGYIIPRIVIARIAHARQRRMTTNSPTCCR